MKRVHKKLKKTRYETKNLWNGHSPYPQLERGHAKSVDYGSVSKWPKKMPGALPLPPNMSIEKEKMKAIAWQSRPQKYPDKVGGNIPSNVPEMYPIPGKMGGNGGKWEGIGENGGK